MRKRFESIRRAASDDPAWFCFLMFAGAAMLSLPLARLFLGLSLFFTIRAKTRLRMTPPAWGWIAYLVLAIVVTAAVAAANTPWGVEHGFLEKVDKYIEPAKGLRKTTKLLWYVSIPVAATLVNSRKRLRSVIGAMLVGGTALALWTVLVNPVIALMQTYWHPSCGFIDKLLSSRIWHTPDGRPISIHHALPYLGTMHDAQRLMVTLVCGACAMAATRREGGPWHRQAVAIAISAIALVVTCKRGPLVIGACVAFAVLVTEFRPWRILPFAVLLACAALAVPTTRARFAALPREFDPANSGRAAMWTIVVPRLHQQYPYGIGFRSLTARKMRRTSKQVEKHRNHVHSSPLQAFVDLSWAGVAVWLFWMGAATACAVRMSRIFPPLSAAPLCALSALIVFSLVEYNLADGAVIPLYGLAMGIASAKGVAKTKDSPTEIAQG